MQKSKNKKKAQNRDCFICAFKYGLRWGWIVGTTLMIDRCPHSARKSARAQFVPDKNLFVFPFLLYSSMIINFEYNVDLLLNVKTYGELPKIVINIMFCLMSFSVLYIGFAKREALAKDFNNYSKIIERKCYYGIDHFLTSKNIFYFRLGNYAFLLFLVVLILCIICLFSLPIDHFPIYTRCVESAGMILGILSLAVPALQAYYLSFVYRIVYEKCYDEIMLILNKNLTKTNRYKRNTLCLRPELRLEEQLKRLRQLYMKVTKNFLSLNDHANPIFTFVWIEGVITLICSFFHVIAAQKSWRPIDFFVSARDSSVVFAIFLFAVVAQQIVDFVSSFYY